MRKLSREYGWAALGVYLGLSALDFPFCFVAVRLLGVERIGHIEHVILDSIKSVLPIGSGGTETEPESGDEQAESQLARAEQRSRSEGASTCYIILEKAWSGLLLTFS